MSATFRVPDDDPKVSRRLLSFELPFHPTELYAFVPTIVRGPRGMVAWHHPQTLPEPMLVLYEFESCPFCRRVREVLCELDLPYESRPCANGGRFRDELMARSGSTMVPYLVDEASGVEMHESADIIAHLWRTWIGQPRPLAGRAFSPLETAAAALGSALRPMGRRVRAQIASRPTPVEPLQLWNIEASPYCRRVRETLCELDLPCVVFNVGKKSRHRAAFRERFGRVQVPLLFDPNTDTTLIESRAIVAWLNETYGGS